MKINIIGKVNYFQLLEIKEIIDTQRTTDRVRETVEQHYYGNEGLYYVNIKCDKDKDIKSITVRLS